MLFPADRSFFACSIRQYITYCIMPIPNALMDRLYKAVREQLKRLQMSSHVGGRERSLFM